MGTIWGTSSLNSTIALADDPTTRMDFQFMPETIRDAKEAKWIAYDIIGRSEPVRAYRASDPRRLDFTLFFAASVDESDDGKPEDVKRRVDFCQSLVYPEYVGSTTLVSTPPVVYLIIGETINTRCICTSVSAEWLGPWAVEVGEDIPVPGFDSLYDTDIPHATHAMLAKVNIAFEEISLTPWTSKLVRDGRPGFHMPDSISYKGRVR